MYFLIHDMLNGTYVQNGNDEQDAKSRLFGRLPKLVLTPGHKVEALEPKPLARELHVLPTRTNMDPMRADENQFYDRQQVAYVMQDAYGSSRFCITSFGELDLELGQELFLTHDQTRRSLGLYVVIGIADFDKAEVIGEMPGRKVAHSVVK
jgi:hypothetical protein